MRNASTSPRASLRQGEGRKRQVLGEARHLLARRQAAAAARAQPGVAVLHGGVARHAAHANEHVLRHGGAVGQRKAPLPMKLRRDTTVGCTVIQPRRYARRPASRRRR